MFALTVKLAGLQMSDDRTLAIAPRIELQLMIALNIFRFITFFMSGLIKNFAE